MNGRIKELPKETRPYEKCEAHGPGVLTDSELLAVILRTGTRGENSISLADRILQKADSSSHKGLAGLLHLSLREFKDVPGIGRVKAIQLKCIGELSRRIATQAVRPSLSMDCPDSIACFYMERLRHEDQEHLYCMMLDIRAHFLGEAMISRGTANATLITPREIFIEALKMRAMGIVLVHNHPSGDPSPSLSDRDITRRVYEAGRLVGIELLDHIIIGDQRYYSFKEENSLPTAKEK